MKIFVGQHEIQIEKENIVNQNEYKVTKCQFEFSQEYTNDLVKIALFTNSAGTYKEYIVNNECEIPTEILEKQETSTLGVYAYKEESNELQLRYSPEEINFYINKGSYRANAENTEPVTSTDKEQMEQILQDGINDINEKISEANIAITEANNLNIDINKVDKVATVTLTRKNGTTKTVDIRDGYDLDYDWQGTELGVKREDDQNYEYVDLKGEKGDCYFATFEIINGRLKMNKPDNLSQIDFNLDNRGHLVMEVMV